MEVQSSKKGFQLVCFILLTAYCLLLTDANAFCFEEAGKTYGINPSLLKSIAQIESSLNPKAMNKNQNGSIDIGLMQINSFWLKPLKLDAEKLISNPCYNTMIGAKILKQCIDRYGYTWEAVGCYNAVSEPKKVRYSWKIFNRLKSEDKKQSGIPTQNSELKTPNSELYFSVREKQVNSTSERDSPESTAPPVILGQSLELKMEAQ